MVGELTLEQRLSQLQQTGLSTALSNLQHGIEKEGLRVQQDGRIAQTEHPKSLGSALANDRITTDYSEALLEFITPVYGDVTKALDYLKDLHRFTYEKLEQETIWLASMPPKIKGEDEIPIAYYGDSNVGKMKYVYRVGLANRYGKLMQTIAGIHYNFSVSEEFWPAYQQLLGLDGDITKFRSSQYFSLIRNFRRYSWLLIYLFGASPAVSRSFLSGKEIEGLEQHDEQTLVGPFATSLRMSDLGYSNDAQASLNICYNQLGTYAKTLEEAINASYPDYENIGVKKEGEYQQLNTNLLQIENEYYSDIRPKRVTRSGEKPINALQQRGVEYVEVRNVDINPFMPVGINATQAHFLDSFLVYCLLKPSPEISSQNCDRIKRNHRAVVWQGRNPSLQLETGHNGELRLMSEWAHELVNDILEVATILDNGDNDGCHSQAVTAQREKINQPELTPSGQVLAELNKGVSYEAFVLQQSQQLHDRLMTEPMVDDRREELETLANQSCVEQQKIEQQDHQDFDEYLANYFSQ